MDVSDRYMPQDWILPAITRFNADFLTSGELRVQRCMKCQTVQHPPMDVCHACQSFEFEYVRAEPRGVIDSFTIVHHPTHDSLKDRVPYNVCVIALADHPHVRVVGNVIDAKPGQIAIGEGVTATWAVIPGDERVGQIRLPQWRLAAAAEQGSAR